jgi:pyridoxal phosphate enzyme (YggS family)
MTMSDTLQDRFDGVKRRIGEACARAGRNPETVRLVAVSKTFGPEAVKEAAECGQVLFGESKVQEAKPKISMCPGHLEWHMVGHLQRNKVRDATRLFRMIHSVDSLRLLETISASCREMGNTMPVCLEVNVSGERSKFGMLPEDVPATLDKASTLMGVDIVGVMTIPPFAEDPAEGRPFFKRLRELRDEWHNASGIELPELSMGMSNDFEVAIEEGATLVRVGTVLFGDRKAMLKPADVEPVIES